MLFRYKNPTLVDFTGDSFWLYNNIYDNENKWLQINSGYTYFSFHLI